MPVNRRRFFTRTGLLATATVAAPAALRSAGPGATPAGPKPRRIIHLVSDGMSAGTLSCADHLSRLLRGRGLTWLRLYNQPGVVTALMDMRSLDSLVTDSSAAACAWGSGSRIVNGTVNILPDGTVLKTLYELFGQAGWKRALVTTTEITHATPAGFAASGLRREAAEDIAIQYLERNLEVLLGGGQRYFDPAKRKDQQDLLPRYRAQGYQVFQTAAELATARKDAKWLGIFSASHLPFTVDQRQDAKLQAAVPTLAEMTRRALAKLENEPRFIIQVEGGRVDHGCHMCDAASAFYDQIAFDEAIDVCVEFQKQQPDTLLVLATDHGNGNPGLNGLGTNYAFSSPLFANLQEVKASFTEILKRLGIPEEVQRSVTGLGALDPKAKPLGSAKEIAAVIQELTGYACPLERAEMFAPFLNRQGRTMFTSMNSAAAQLGQMMANHTGVGWTLNAHTSDFVPLLALGPGAERFRGFIQSVDVFRHYTQLAGIDFKNPEAPIRDDQKLPGKADEAGAAHWLNDEGVAV